MGRPTENRITSYNVCYTKLLRAGLRGKARNQVSSDLYAPSSRHLHSAEKRTKVVTTLDKLKALVIHGLESVFDQNEEF